MDDDDPGEVLREDGWQQQQDGSYQRDDQPGIVFVVQGASWTCGRDGQLHGHSRHHEPTLRDFLRVLRAARAA